MKSIFLQAVVVFSSIVLLSSCATVFGGARTPYQITKPREGEPQRQVRVGALIADIILFPPGVIVDFATGAIYKPAPVKIPFAPTPPATPTSAKQN